jgi:hypothetical protein
LTGKIRARTFAKEIKLCPLADGFSIKRDHTLKIFCAVINNMLHQLTRVADRGVC